MQMGEALNKEYNSIDDIISGCKIEIQKSDINIGLEKVYKVVGCNVNICCWNSRPSIEQAGRHIMRMKLNTGYLLLKIKSL